MPPESSSSRPPVPLRPKASILSAQAAAQTVAIYVGVSILWIWGSDSLLFSLGLSTDAIRSFALIKGWVFVGVTAALLFWLLNVRLRKGLEHEEKMQLFIEHAPVAIAMLDREMRYVTVSARWKSDYRLGLRDLRGRRHYDVFPEIPERWREIHRRALAGGTIRSESEAFERLDGSVQWLRWEVRPWFDAEGGVGGVIMFTEDITDRRQAEDALLQAQSRLKMALGSGRAGTWIWDMETGRIDCDEATARLVGRTADELVEGGIDLFHSCVHPDDRQMVSEALAACLRGGGEFNCEFRVVHPDGTVVHFAVRGRVEHDGAGRPLRMAGAFVDMTDMKRMERALRDSEDRFREVVETIREVFWISDVAKSKVLYVSPGFEEIWGRPCDEIYHAMGVWIDSIHPGDRARVVDAATKKQVLGTYDEIYRIVRPDGSVRWVRDQAYPVKDHHGEVVRVVGVAEDVTDGKRLEEQFLRAQRLEAIGTLASGVAHDLNNILAPMLMIAPMLRPRLSEAGDLDMLTIVERSAQRGADVVRQLLTFSRGIAGERGPIQVRHLVKEMVAIMRETFPREIGITQDVPPDLPLLVGDATQLHQVLMNLCVNARDAMPRGGRLSLNVSTATFGEAQLRGYVGAKPGRYVVLTMEDTGEGIDPEILPRIFEPFFSTKEVGSGTGLGLSTVLGIVNSHEGFITVESEPGTGTMFHVHLPAADSREASAAPLERTPLPAGNGELVLVVDDEPAVRRATQRVLEKFGYRVLSAANGREGLALFLLQRENVRAVVTDLMMPEMNGIALVTSLRELNPDLAIVAATGLEQADNSDDLLTLGVRELLPKPYAPAELVAALDRELKRAAELAEK